MIKRKFRSRGDIASDIITAMNNADAARYSDIKDLDKDMMVFYTDCLNPGVGATRLRRSVNQGLVVTAIEDAVDIIADIRDARIVHAQFERMRMINGVTKRTVYSYRPDQGMMLMQAAGV